MDAKPAEAGGILFPSFSVAGGMQSGLDLLPGDFFLPVPVESCGVLQKTRGGCSGKGNMR